MDDETISTFNTVCTAGHACAGFNGKTNEQLQQLASVGLLVVANAPDLVARQPSYTPTHKGWELFRRLVHGKKSGAGEATGA